MTSGSLSGTASLASNALLLQGTGSVGFATTASLLEVSSSQQQISSSLLQVSSSQQQISASLLNVVANYATTGSNSFRANQSITGSLVVSSTITAQTLVVQTVTSSIVYSSGSNNFGNQLANTQTFTGSVNITGSLTVNTTGTEFQVNNNGVVVGNLLTDNHSMTGSVGVTGSLNVNIPGSSTQALAVKISGSAYNGANVWFQDGSSTDGISFGGTGVNSYKTLQTYGGALYLNQGTQNGLVVGGTSIFSGSITATSTIASNNAIGVEKNGSGTFGGGGRFYLYNAATTDGMLMQLNASNNIDYWGVTSNTATASPVITFTRAGSATFGSDVFTYANGGIFFNGGGSYGSGIFQQSGGALALQTGTTPRLTIASTGTATFTNSITAPSLYGNSYAQTSTSGTTSFVNTGIFYNTSITGFGNNSIYNLVISGNPNGAGSSEYRSVYLGYITITTGYDFGISSVVQRISYTQVITGDAYNIGALTISVVFWNGTTETTQQITGTTSNQIRVKITGYNSSNIGAGQTVLITKVN